MGKRRIYSLDEQVDSGRSTLSTKNTKNSNMNNKTTISNMSNKNNKSTLSTKSTKSTLSTMSTLSNSLSNTLSTGHKIKSLSQNTKRLNNLQKKSIKPKLYSLELSDIDDNADLVAVPCKLPKTPSNQHFKSAKINSTNDSAKINSTNDSIVNSNESESAKKTDTLSLQKSNDSKNLKIDSNLIMFDIPPRLDSYNNSSYQALVLPNRQNLCPVDQACLDIVMEPFSPNLTILLSRYNSAVSMNNMSAIQQTKSNFCLYHKAEVTVIPAGLAKGYRPIDLTTLADRLMSLKHLLLELLDPENNCKHRAYVKSRFREIGLRAHSRTCI
jgi:hypothetical protein